MRRIVKIELHSFFISQRKHFKGQMTNHSQMLNTDGLIILSKSD